MARAEARLEVDDVGAVDDARDHLVDVVGAPVVDGHDAGELVGVVDGRRHVRARQRRTAGVPAEAPHEVAAQQDAVRVVLGEVLDESRDRRVHLGAAELLLVRDLAGRRLRERRPRERRHAVLADADHVVAHAGVVGAAGRRRAVQERDRRDAGRAALREPLEHAPALRPHLDLVREEIGSGALDEMDERQPEAEREVEALDRP